MGAYNTQMFTVMKSRKITGQELSKKSGVSSMTISKMLNYKHKFSPGYETLLKIAKILECQVSDLGFTFVSELQPK